MRSTVSLIPALLVGAVVFALLNSSAGDAFVYSKPLTAVMQDPDQFMGRPLKVEGELRQGSIQFREDPCEWRFVLEEGDQEMPVRFPRCVVPDTFRDGFGTNIEPKKDPKTLQAWLVEQKKIDVPFRKASRGGPEKPN